MQDAFREHGLAWILCMTRKSVRQGIDPSATSAVVGPLLPATHPIIRLSEHSSGPRQLAAPVLHVRVLRTHVRTGKET